MDLTTIEANKPHFIFKSLIATPANGFSTEINSIPFTPDYMIVHTIMYEPAAADFLGPYFLYCDLVGSDIGVFMINQLVDGDNNLQNAMNTAKLYFRLQKPVQGTISFTFRSKDPIQTYVLGGDMAIVLEFVKLKAEKPQFIN
jgi:hypothetical protein